MSEKKVAKPSDPCRFALLHARLDRLRLLATL
jgi:hypothetical protein